MWKSNAMHRVVGDAQTAVVSVKSQKDEQEIRFAPLGVRGIHPQL